MSYLLRHLIVVGSRKQRFLIGMLFGKPHGYVKVKQFDLTTRRFALIRYYESWSIRISGGNYIAMPSELVLRSLVVNDGQGRHGPTIEHPLPTRSQ